MKKTFRWGVVLTTSLALNVAPWAIPQSSAATAPRPQVVIALGNSQSMDGDLGGAIMTGSGQLPSGLSSLVNSSSPLNYTVPSGFTPPLTPTQTASAPYTVSQNSTLGELVDNGASRLNVAKANIGAVLNQYLPSMDFALEDYSTSETNLDSTWVYYMSPSGGFQFASTVPTNGFTSYAAYQSFVAINPSATPAATRWVVNPCYNYPNASSSVQNACSSIAGLYGSTTLAGSAYMQISASSDDPNINAVLYQKNSSPSPYPGIFVAYNGPSTSSPPSYNSTLPDIGSFTTSPTNAGYVPNSPQVMFAQRGFGYDVSVDNLSATAGNTVVPMTNLGGSPSSSSVSSALVPFVKALTQETNNPSSTEIKSLAPQSPLAGLVDGAGNILGNLTPSCAGQYVILVTDGLPTMDASNKTWAPLGSAAGNENGVNAAFYGAAGNATYGINNDSGNTAGTAGALDISKTNDQALIDTITAIQNLAQKGIKTYVVGLGAGVDQAANPAAYDALNAMAIAGGTANEYPANNVSALTSALSTIATSIYGNVIASSPAVPGYVQNGSLAYVLASDNAYGNEQGFFEAFSTDANGNVSSQPVWSLQMAAQRQLPPPPTPTPTNIPLLTDQGTGSTTIPLAQASAPMFGSPTNPNAQAIINYTIDPSSNSGQYLAGRASGSFLGTVTTQADKPLILSQPNNPYFITKPLYQSFAKANASRAPLVLFTANDGFLYAVSTGSTTSAGTLQWAWMPSVLLPQLQNYTTFQSTLPMNGGLTTVDSADGSGNWATYVVGTAQSGALHYDLELTGCSSSACNPTISKVWYDNQSGATSPPQSAPQAPAIWWDSTGVAYAYYFTTSGSTSYFNVMRLYDGLTSKVQVSFTPSSTSFVDVLGGKLYVGDTAGNIWSFDLTTGTTASGVTGPTNVGTVPNEVAAGPIRYLGYAQTSSGIYIWATTDHQVTVFKFTGGAVTSSTAGWTPWWWSSTSGSGSFSNGPTSAPSWIDAGGTITDKSAVEAGTLIVPVTVSSSTTSCGPTIAKYDFFDLGSGTFPQNKFHDFNGNVITSNPVIGLGTAYAPAISQNGNGSSIVYGTASQNQQGKIGFQVAATSGIHVGPGIMGWQPLWMIQP